MWPGPLTPDDRFGELPHTVRERIRREDHWYWVGSLHTKGNGGAYGYLYLGRSGRRGRRSPMVMIHRYVYELLVGQIPEGLVIDHLCGERLCCRPSHLEAVTLVENSRRVWRTDPGVRRFAAPAAESPGAWEQPELWGMPQ